MMATRKTAPPEPLYALFHVNTKTGEIVRYPRAFEAMSKAKAEDLALGSRQGQARGSAYPSPWETRALPDT